MPKIYFISFRSFAVSALLLVVFATARPQVAALPIRLCIQARRQVARATAAPTGNRVLLKTAALFRLGFEPTIKGALVLGSLRSTRDPALAAYFLRVSRSGSPELQLTGMMDANYVSGNPKFIHVNQLLSNPLPNLISPSLALLIEFGHIRDAQLEKIVHTAPQPAQRLMAAAQLVNRGESTKVDEVIGELLASENPAVRYYAAMSLMQSPNPKTRLRGMTVLTALAASHSPRLRDIKRSLLERVAAQKIIPALPWVRRIALDRKASATTRRRAVETLLLLGDPSGPALLARRIAHARGTMDRIELGFLAMRFGRRLNPPEVAPLAATDSPLLRGIARAALAAVKGRAFLSRVLQLVRQGQPIFLNWLLNYSAQPKARHRRQLLAALVRYATIVNSQRGMDYLRAVAAATLIANADTPADRRTLEGFLKSVNPGVTEAALAGMLRSKKDDFAPLVAPLLPQLYKNRDHRIGQFAAMVLGRQGDRAAMPELRRIVLHDNRRSAGFRAVAGWYYVKMAGAEKQLLDSLHAPPPTTAPQS